MTPTVWLVIPCYEEEEALPVTRPVIEKKWETLMTQGHIAKDSRILLVNDGSKDRTWECIQRFHRENPLFLGINLSRNRGHQNALLAGLMTARAHCDCAISMDADLQDDIHAIDAMLERYAAGSDVVYGVRKKRETDSFFKKWSAQGFYSLIRHMGADVVYNHADYRLMSRRALDGLAEFTEVNLFLRGLVPLVGFPSDVVYYDRSERVAGESKYPLRKMISFAFEGITSLSTKPIQWIMRLGIVVFLVSLIMLIYSVVQYFRGHTVAGWASLITSIWAIGGLILLSIGVIGTYIAKTYLEAKHRPRYLIQEALLDEKDQTEE